MAALTDRAVLIAGATSDSGRAAATTTPRPDVLIVPVRCIALRAAVSARSGPPLRYATSYGRSSSWPAGRSADTSTRARRARTAATTTATASTT